MLLVLIEAFALPAVRKKFCIFGEELNNKVYGNEQSRD
jgi:hypothetical protein